MAPSDSRNPRSCLFCRRVPGPGQHRMPGRRGPICVECVQAGLYVVADGMARASSGGTDLVPLRAEAELACDFCGRGERPAFLGFRRALVRMRCTQSGSVICVDCLDRGGDLFNEVLRH
jgi:hypothetical protein